MGWNDRLPEDPYVPPESFYRDRDDYEAWLEYITAQRHTSVFMSQNIDPDALVPPKHTEAPTRPSFWVRVWAKISGQSISADQNFKESRRARSQQNADVPF